MVARLVIWCISIVLVGDVFRLGSTGWCTLVEGLSFGLKELYAWGKDKAVSLDAAQATFYLKWGIYPTHLGVCLNVKDLPPKVDLQVVEMAGPQVPPPGCFFLWYEEEENERSS